RGRPAGPGHRHAARLTGTVLTAAGGGTRALPVAALRLGGPSTLTIAWLGDRVRTDRGRGRTGDGVPVRGGARRRRLHRKDPEPRRARGSAARQPHQGTRGHLGTGDGV